MGALVVGIASAVLVVAMGFAVPVPHGDIGYAATSADYPLVGWGKSMAFVDGSAVIPLQALEFERGKTTWEYANGSWSTLHTKSSPPAVTWACFAYDPAIGAAVYFGGGFVDKDGLGGIGFADRPSQSTWLFGDDVWSNITKTAGPIPALKYPACAYDPSFDGGAVILFGGADHSYEVDDTWLMDDTNATWAFVHNSTSAVSSWIKLDPTRSPSARFGSAMAYDAATKQLILYGGAENGTSTANGSCSPVVCPHYHDTWEFTGNPSFNAWVELRSGSDGSPPGSVFTSMAYDPIAGYVIDFGGQDNGYKSVNATQGATWAFTASGWENITPAHSPEHRFGAAIAFDPTVGGVLMIGGLGGTDGVSPSSVPAAVPSSVPFDSLWEFANGTWTELSTSKQVGVGWQPLPAPSAWSSVSALSRPSGPAPCSISSPGY